MLDSMKMSNASCCIFKELVGGAAGSGVAGVAEREAAPAGVLGEWFIPVALYHIAIEATIPIHTLLDAHC